MSQDDEPPINYRKRISRFGFSHQTALYEADDHFLLVEGWVRQRCRRFYFDKIQAIVVRPTFRTGLELILTGLPVAFLAFVYALVNPTIDGELIGLFVVFGLPFIALFLFCVIRWAIAGASQDVFFQTAVQTTRIPALAYRRRSRRTLDSIAQTIERVQEGNYNPNHSSEEASSGAPPSTTPAEATPPPPPAAAPPPSPPDLPGS